MIILQRQTRKAAGIRKGMPTAFDSGECGFGLEVLRHAAVGIDALVGFDGARIKTVPLGVAAADVHFDRLGRTIEVLGGDAGGGAVDGAARVLHIGLVVVPVGHRLK